MLFFTLYYIFAIFIVTVFNVILFNVIINFDLI